MGRRLWKSLFTFLLVLVLTVGTIAALSMATAAKTEDAPDRYSRQIHANDPAVTELSAVVPEEETSPWLSMGAFALILAVPAAGAFVLYRNRKSGARSPRVAPAAEAGRSYPSAVNR